MTRPYWIGGAVMVVMGLSFSPLDEEVVLMQGLYPGRHNQVRSAMTVGAERDMRAWLLIRQEYT